MLQCEDGNFYKGAVWVGVTCHGDIELRYHIKSNEDGLHLTLEGQRNYPAKRLATKLGLPVKIGKMSYQKVVYFGSVLPEASSGFEFELITTGLLPIPSAYLLVTSEPMLDDLQNAWQVKFPIESVWNIFQKGLGKYDNNLVAFVLRKSLVDGCRMRNTVKSRLIKQYDMRGMSLEEAVEKFGSRVLVKRNIN
jgi:hypothetical protein